MKNLLGILFLGLFLITPSQADDIREFQIEGMSIGDSLLDHFSKEKIENSLNYDDLPSDMKFRIIEITSSSFDLYKAVQFYYKPNDKNFIIFGISGQINFFNDMEKCKKMQKNILKEIKEILIGKKFNYWEGKHDADPSGKSIYSMYGTEFDNGDIMNITCTDYSEETGWRDHLDLTFRTKHFNDFLGYAYN